MSLGCGCGTYTPINRIINATVCQNYFVIIDVACANPTNISTPEFGTAVSAVGQIIYTHNDELYTSETDSFTFKCNGVTYTVNLIIEQTIPPTTTVVTFSATGSCEVGNPTYTWNIPDCATLVEGYSVHDQVIEVIVPMFNPENPTAVCTLTVDVCCDYCHNCCKCETINWYPPNCTLECGEDPDCNCNHLPCHIYNPISGNCEPICTGDTRCCPLSDVVTQVIPTLSIECSQQNEQEYSFSITSDYYNSNSLWQLAGINNADFDGDCVLVSSLAITGFYSVDPGEDYLIELDPVNPSSLLLNFISDGNEPGNGLIFIGLRTPLCNVYYAFQILVSSQLEDNLCDGGIEFNSYYIRMNDLTQATAEICAYCDTSNPSSSYFCAECCDTDDCYIAGCPNTNMICYNNSCYCILNDGSYIPAPTDGTCCPSCTEDTVPDCYECINGVIIPPDDCPVGQIYDWDTCTCTGTPCSEFNCLNPESPSYCPEQPDCGCADVPNSNVDVCVPCNSVSCTANIDCPLGCYCLDGTCTGNPCFTFDCVNTNPNVYCPTQEEGCFCDDTECLPCNSVSCTGDIDCPFGCICDENIQTCIGNPCATFQCENPSSVTYCPPQINCGCDELLDCIPCSQVSCTANIDCPEGCTCINGTCDGPCGTLQVNCDAYLLHHENDLTLNKICNIPGTYRIHPILALEPSAIITNTTPIWEVNLSNYIDGWVIVPSVGGINLPSISGPDIVNAIRVDSNGDLLITYVGTNIDYLAIQCTLNGRKVWYRLESVSEGIQNCNTANLDLGGAYLCGEIFTIESLSGIEWTVTEWIFDPTANVTYQGPQVLVYECAGTEPVTITANVTNEVCEISTCPFEYLCNCVGSQPCSVAYINMLEDKVPSVSGTIWTVVADVLYPPNPDGSIDFAWYDCEIPNVLQLPTNYSCSNCGSSPYESAYIPNPTGDNLNDINPPFCSNPFANDNCNCVCGWTYYGAELIHSYGSLIQVRITDPYYAQVCFQTDVVGNSLDGDDCCLSSCLTFVEVTGCNTSIQNLTTRCNGINNHDIIFTYVSLEPIATIHVSGVLVTNYTITAGNVVTINDIIIPDNHTLIMTITNVSGCVLTAEVQTECCINSAMLYDILPIYCTSVPCQVCGLNYQETVIGYTINLTGQPSTYSMFFDSSSDYIVTNPTSLLSINNSSVTVMYDFLNPSADICTNLFIDNIILNYVSCSAVLTTPEIFYECDDDCGSPYKTGNYSNQTTCLVSCDSFGCSGDIVTGVIVTPEIPLQFNLKIGGMNFGSAVSAEIFFQNSNPSAAVINYQNLGNGLELLYVSGIDKIYANQFNANNNITYIEDLSGFITSVDTKAFKGAINLQEAIFPSATQVQSESFKNTHSLSNISLPNVTFIGSESFRLSTTLVSGIFDSCLTASQFAFQECSNLKYLDLSNCLEIGNYCFAFSSNLEEIYLDSCIKLGSYTGNESPPVMDNVFHQCFNYNLHIYVNNYLSNVVPSGIQVTPSIIFYSDADLEYYYYLNSLVNVSAQQILVSGIIFI